MDRGARLIVAALCAALACAGPAAAGSWLPHDASATWTYQWTDTQYAPTPTTEKVTVDKSSNATSFMLDWTTDGQSNPAGAVSSNGSVSFVETNFGIRNTNWNSNQPPEAFPVLCASLACGNSLASTYYNVIWGTRTPVFAEPILKGLTWSSTGGAQNDVTSSSTYLGTEQITVPAFPQPVTAAKIQTTITQAGALGDPYGSGVRTTWWVYGVGPVKIVFAHSGGSGAPVTTSVLQSTSETPAPPPADTSYFPLDTGQKGVYRWTNTRYFKKPEVEKFAVSQAANATAIFTFSSVSGPMKVSGAYQFTTRTDGVTSVASQTKAASLAKLPELGPSALPPPKRRHFFTPFDLMTFGFNPLLPATPAQGNTWGSDPNSRDFAIYGVTGSSRIAGVQKVTVPAGTFPALVVSSALTQPGFKFGSGTRTCWFAPDKGLVKLVFRHADGSVSTVELIK